MATNIRTRLRIPGHTYDEAINSHISQDIPTTRSPTSLGDRAHNMPHQSPDTLLSASCSPRGPARQSSSEVHTALLSQPLTVITLLHQRASRH